MLVHFSYTVCMCVYTCVLVCVCRESESFFPDFQFCTLNLSHHSCLNINREALWSIWIHKWLLSFLLSFIFKGGHVIKSQVGIPMLRIWISLQVSAPLLPVQLPGKCTLEVGGQWLECLGPCFNSRLRLWPAAASAVVGYWMLLLLIHRGIKSLSISLFNSLLWNGPI